MVEVSGNHARIVVVTPDGERETVMSCKIESEDINEDGTVSTPTSGECDCFEEMPSRQLFR